MLICCGLRKTAAYTVNLQLVAAGNGKTAAYAFYFFRLILLCCFCLKPQHSCVADLVFSTSEYWPVKKVFKQRMEVIEMRMLRWMCCSTMMDRIKNQEFKEKLGVAPLSAKMRENRLRWFLGMCRKRHMTPQ